MCHMNEASKKMAVRRAALLVIAAIISQSAAVDFCKSSSPYLSADLIVLNIAYMNACEDQKTYGINATAGDVSCSFSNPTSNLTLNGSDTNGVVYSVSFLYTKTKDGGWSTNITFSIELGSLPHVAAAATGCVVASGYMLPNDTYLGSNVGALDGYGCSLASASSNGTSCSFNNTVSSVNVTLKNWSVRPFGSATTGSINKCSPDITSIVVPIAVGAALAGLVVLVIVVWVAGKLWERYKAKKTGGVSYDKL